MAFFCTRGTDVIRLGPCCNEREGPGCASAWVNIDCFGAGFRNTGNNAAIVLPALIKSRTRDRLRGRIGKREVGLKGASGEKVGKKERVRARAIWNVTETEHMRGGGSGEKERDGVRGRDLLSHLFFFFFTLALCLRFTPSSPCFITLLSSQP